jgi:putative aminopeptidase FrvX
MPLTHDAAAFLHELMAAGGPAGFEGDTQRLVRDYLARRLPKGCPLEIDRNDNLTAAVRPDARPKVLLMAHADTVGLIVQHVDAGGFLRVANIGQPRAEALVGQLVTVHAAGGPLPGVLYRRTDGEKKAVTDDLAVDCGFPDAKTARKLVRPGDCISFARAPAALAGGRLAGPGTDDRVGVFVATQVLLAAAKAKKGPAVTLASVVQEEGPTHLGAVMTAAAAKPDLIVCLDTTQADDFTGGERIRLGGGPLVARGGCVHKRTADALIALAQSAKIPCQIEPIGRTTGTDLESALQFAAGSAIGVLVSIPHRHYHTPNEVVDPADIQAAIALLTRFLADLPKDV